MGFNPLDEMPSSPSVQLRLNSEILLGKGLTSEVFSWGTDRVFKLFLPWVPMGTVEREFAVTRLIHASGVPSPAAFEIIQAGSRCGIIFERVSGVSLLQSVSRRPWTLFAAARQLAELHAQVHAYSVPGELRSQRAQIERWLANTGDLTGAEINLAQRRLAELPAGNGLCHGDFHPANILLTTRGPVIIDWSAATRGYALADVARTSVLFERATLPADAPFHTHLLMKIARGTLHTTYLKRYFSLRGGTINELEHWRVLQRIAGGGWREQKPAGIQNPDLPIAH